MATFTGALDDTRTIDMQAASNQPKSIFLQVEVALPARARDLGSLISALELVETPGNTWMDQRVRAAGVQPAEGENGANFAEQGQRT